MFSYASDMNDSGYAFAYTLTMLELEGRGYYDIIYSLLSSDGKVTELANGTGISAVYDDKYIGFRQAERKDETTLDFTREYAVFSSDGTQLTDYYDRIVKAESCSSSVTVRMTTAGCIRQSCLKPIRLNRSAESTCAVLI
ncbi:MAG: hypothetical protein ACLTZI_00840 [[Eubacterium] siraeum]